MILKQTNTRSVVTLRSVAMEEIGHISVEALAYHELKQDPSFMYVQRENVCHLVKKLIHFGKQTAQKQVEIHSLQKLINQLLKDKICIHFAESHPEDISIRATYSKKKKPTISIYRQSIQQIQQFFQKELTLVDEQDLYLLHLLHEWFHHLEETSVGRADHRYAKYSRKLWGPKQVFTQKMPLSRAREVAAHAFTQEKLQLKWSPLLLDHLLHQQQCGLTVPQIQEKLSELENAYTQIHEECTSSND